MAEIVQKIKKGSIGVIPTDTIYGLVGSAFSKKAVQRIYRVRGRDTRKPFIVLINSVNDLKRFGIKPEKRLWEFLRKVWPGPVSVILPVPDKKFSYLHRGTKTIAFRLPKDKWLRNVLKKTGSLVAPSANPEGKKPGITAKETKRYFGDRIDFYVDRGSCRGIPSSVIEIKRI